MSEHTTICPSGLTVTVRGLSAAEMDLFANKQEVANKTISTRILQSCVVEVTDLGPIYQGLDPKQAAFWDNVLVCDRFAALLAIRIATHGPAYAFKVRCTFGGCEKQFEWVEQLDTLPQYELPVASYANACEDAPFRAELSNGTEFFFRLIRGAGEREIASQIEKNFRARVTTGLARRVCGVTLDGVTYKDYHRISTWIRNLSMDESLELITCMDDVDGGYETDIKIMCPYCTSEMQVSLPFDEGFWVKKPPSDSKSKRVVRQSRG